MEIVKVNLNTPTEGIREVKFSEIFETTDELLIKLNNINNVKNVQKLYFIRYIYCENNTHYTISDAVDILKVDKEKSVVHTTKIPKRRYSIKDIDYYDDENACIIYCLNQHYLFPQNIIDDTIYIKDENGRTIGEYNNVYIPVIFSNRASNSDDCVKFIGREDGCNKLSRGTEYYEYIFSPDIISKKAIRIDNFNKNIIDKAKYLETKFNPYYYYEILTDENGNPEELDKYGKPIKRCYLHGDIWWDNLKDTFNSGRKVIENNGKTRAIIGINNLYFELNIGLSIDQNDNFYSDDSIIGTTLTKNIIDSLIPEVIDMERVKYSPMIYNDGELTNATKLNFKLHFRDRKKIDDSDRHLNTIATSGNVYYDSWHIDNNTNDTTWWNGMKYEGSNFNSTEFSNFIKENGEKSDLLGYLNFTDNDVFYRKKKISKSFLRLSFYTSTDPIEQKLLYYSTVFMDSNELYSKYLKQLTYIEDNNIILNVMNNNAKIVFNDNINPRLDSSFSVTNEYNRDKSSEGFNIYLFSQDTLYNIDENLEKTIYLKVEFNHAGNGKTIPLIAWPMENGEYVPLTVDNYNNSLYIPIKLAYINSRYVYYIPDAYKNNNNEITLVLFEPKLDFDELKGIKNDFIENG